MSKYQDQITPEYPKIRTPIGAEWHIPGQRYHKGGTFINRYAIVVIFRMK